MWVLSRVSVAGNVGKTFTQRSQPPYGSLQKPIANKTPPFPAQLPIPA
ncbi:hypothetical protein AM1_C0226 (plasmid) [Acaryochloris marina MBIC11017]|uniref:Uncharacterized protein n=1 Tax=Acaryochloris marina (strain MBIC 11017) TaxID=329726 RepID=A8ZMW1_ACAM1|nr:hypothetical protein AM1_C0226 [Acaryochloris marina MBIC11017]